MVSPRTKILLALLVSVHESIAVSVLGEGLEKVTTVALLWRRGTAKESATPTIIFRLRNLRECKRCLVPSRRSTVYFRRAVSNCDLLGLICFHTERYRSSPTTTLAIYIELLSGYK